MIFTGCSFPKDPSNSFLKAHRPEHVDGSGKDELIDNLRKRVATMTRVKDVSVRFRECGQVYIGEVYVIANIESVSPAKIEATLKKLENFDWKIRDITIMVVEELPEALETLKD